jgi:hypothetical protein
MTTNAQPQVDLARLDRRRGERPTQRGQVAGGEDSDSATTDDDGQRSGDEADAVAEHEDQNPGDPEVDAAHDEDAEEHRGQPSVRRSTHWMTDGPRGMF